MTFSQRALQYVKHTTLIVHGPSVQIWKNSTKTALLYMDRFSFVFVAHFHGYAADVRRFGMTG